MEKEPSVSLWQVALLLLSLLPGMLILSTLTAINPKFGLDDSSMDKAVFIQERLQCFLENPEKVSHFDEVFVHLTEFNSLVWDALLNP